MGSSSCPELHDISMYIRDISSKRIGDVKNKLGVMFIIYKYIYVYPFYNFILYLQGYNYFNKTYADYLYLVEQEIRFCEKQVQLGFTETPIKSLDTPYSIKYSRKLLNNKKSSKLSIKNENAELKKYSRVIIDIDKDSFFIGEDADKKFELLFLTKKELASSIQKYTSTGEKLIYIMSLHNIMQRVKNDFDNFDAARYDSKGVYLFELSHNCPELVYFIEFMAHFFKDKSDGGEDVLNLYILKDQIEFQASQYGDLLSYLKSQMEYFEKLLSIENISRLNMSPNVTDKPLKPAGTKVSNKTTRAKKSVAKKGRGLAKIVWRGSEKQLIDLFFLLSQALLMKDYKEDEIVAHFVNDRLEDYKLQEKIKYSNLVWLGTDQSFAQLIDMLASNDLIASKNKYNNFTAHFLNKEWKEFKWLPQKNNFGKSYSTPNEQIVKAIEEILKDKVA